MPPIKKSTPVLVSALLLALIPGCATSPTPANAPAMSTNVPAGPTSQLDHGDQIPRPLVQTGPVYPPALRQQNISGYAVVGFIVDTEGDVRDVRVIQATHEEFGAAAVACVSEWKFQPGVRGGRKVNVRLSVPIHFDFSKAAAKPSTAAGTPEPPP
jgi:TonB family protein